MSLVALAAQVDSSPTGHGTHLLLLLAVWVAVVVGAELRKTAALHTVPLTLVATSLSGCIHLAVTPEHYAESAAYGAFFAVAGCVQLVWCLWWRRHPSARLLELGGLASLAVVLLWAETRFVGYGVGPLSSGTERIGWHDAVSTALEMFLVLTALLSVRGRSQARRGEVAAESTLVMTPDDSA